MSHESALELLGLSDSIPDLIHLSVPRARRKLSRRSGVALHTTTRPLDGSDVVVRDGIRLTAPARTIADVAEAGVAPEQVVRAAQQAIDRGLTTPSRLREAAHGRGRRSGSGRTVCGTPAPSSMARSSGLARPQPARRRRDRPALGSPEECRTRRALHGGPGVIGRPELSRLSVDGGVSEGAQEEDYVLAWLLAVRATLGPPSLVFQGGTALRRCYLPG